MAICVSMYFFWGPIWERDGFVFDWLTREQNATIAFISPGAGSGTWRAANLATGRLWSARSVGCSLIRRGSELALVIMALKKSWLGPKGTTGTWHEWVKPIQRQRQPYIKIYRLQPSSTEASGFDSALRRHQCQQFSDYAIGRASGETWGLWDEVWICVASKKDGLMGL